MNYQEIYLQGRPDAVSVSREPITVLMALVALFINPLLSQLGWNGLGYLCFAAIAGAYAIRNHRNWGVPFNLKIWLAALFISYLAHAWNPGQWTYAGTASLVYYLFIPFLFGRFVTWPVSGFLSVVCWLAAINGVFVLAEFQGLFYLISANELTQTNGVIHPRYSGLLGSSLASGQMAGTAFVVFASRYGKSEYSRHRILLIFAMTLCMLSIMLSYSRNGFVFVIAGLFVLIFVAGNKAILSSLALFGAVTCIAVAILLVGDGAIYPEAELVIGRFASVFDFSQDEGNILRVRKWLWTMSIISDNFLMGLGPGSVSSVGFDSQSGAESARIAESFPLKLFAENGVAIGGVLFVVLLRIIWSSASILARGGAGFESAVVTISLFAGSLGLQTLENPIQSLIFWYCAGSVLYVYSTNARLSAPPIHRFRSRGS